VKDQSVSEGQHHFDTERALLPAGKLSSLSAEHICDNEMNAGLMLSSASVPSRMLDVGLNTSWNSLTTASSDFLDHTCTSASALTISHGNIFN